MSEQYEFKFGSSTVENKKDIKANFDLQTGSWTAEQDVTHFKEHVNLERQKQEYYGVTNKGYRKMATIPDIVAMDINEKYGIDLHDPTFMQDIDKKAKFKKILQTEYPHLMYNS
jgi:hypothetical protein